MTDTTRQAYRLFALDMDGTLLDPQKKIDPESLRDIAWASEQGVTVVYCTGRGVPELREYFDQAPMMRYAVCNSCPLSVTACLPAARWCTTARRTASSRSTCCPNSM